MRLILLTGLLLSFGCASADATDDAESGDEAVIAGKETFDHPEIGQVRHGNGLCTGTLVRPNVVITALHCTIGGADNKDVSAENPSYSFIVIKSATEQHTYQVDRLYNVFAQPADFAAGGQAWRKKDIALLHLSTSVPATVAKPAGIAHAKPWLGGHVAVFGYGCTDRTPGADGRRPGAGTKRFRAYQWDLELALGFGHTSDVCPGDSGGPLFDLDHGVVFGTNSGYVGADDYFGDVPASADAIEAVLARWK